MSKAQGYLKSLLNKLKTIRETSGLSPAQLEDRLILGPGWITRFETGETIPSIDMLLAILHQTGSSLPDLLEDIPDHLAASEIERIIYAEQVGNDLVIHFRYAKHDAKYTLPNGKVEEFETVIKTLRDGLARLSETEADLSEAIKSDSVAMAFLKAVEVWPHVNPSDLWWFVIYRAYCDPYNHPAHFARMDFTQSWKRTGGWALEEVLVRHYGPFLKTKGINLFIANSETKQNLVNNLEIEDRIEADKIDVVLNGNSEGKEMFFGVVHVKASFAERRTDDVPMSTALKQAGFTSPLWTMDCKSVPADEPVNKGELGEASGRRSAKRKDIEDEGYFTGCFSYNSNTSVSNSSLPSEQRIYVCNFQNPDDEFSRFIISRWQARRSS